MSVSYSAFWDAAADFSASLKRRFVLQQRARDIPRQMAAPTIELELEGEPGSEPWVH